MTFPAALKSARPVLGRLLPWMGVLALAACGGGSESAPDVLISGTVAGLTSDGLVLANGNVTVAVSSGDSTFAFEQVSSGDYDVKVLSQPVGQTCVVSSGKGTAASGASTVTGVAVSCRSYQAYVVNNTSGTVSHLSVGTGGGLTAVSTVTTSLAPSAILVDGGGRYAWVRDQDDNTLTLHVLQADGRPQAAVAGPEADYTGHALALDPTESVLYVPNESGPVTAFRVGDAGALTRLSSTKSDVAGALWGVALTPSGAYAYATSNNARILQFTASVGSGLTSMANATSISVADQGTKPQGVVVHPTGTTLYTVLAGSNKVASYDIGSTGVLTAKSTATTGAAPRTLVLTSDGACGFVVNQSGASVTRLNTAKGGLTAVGTTSVGSSPSALAVSPDDAYLYVANKGDGTVSQFAIAGGCALTALTPATVAVGVGPLGIVVR